MEAVLKAFYVIVDDIRRKPYDLLDYTKNTFDRDYLEFNVNIHDLDSQMQVPRASIARPPAAACGREGCTLHLHAALRRSGLHCTYTTQLTVLLPSLLTFSLADRPLWTRRLITSRPQTMRSACWRSSPRCCSATRCSSSWRASGW